MTKNSIGHFRKAQLTEIKEGVIYYVMSDYAGRQMYRQVLDTRPQKKNGKGKDYSPDQKKLNMKRYSEFFKVKHKRGELWIKLSDEEENEKIRNKNQKVKI